MKPTYDVDAVAFERSPGEWVAQCLQYDIGAQATTLTDLIDELQRVIVGHMVIALENDLKPLECLASAPQEYWDMWRQARHTIKVERLPFRMPSKAPRFAANLKLAA